MKEYNFKESEISFGIDTKEGRVTVSSKDEKGEIVEFHFSVSQFESLINAFLQNNVTRNTYSRNEVFRPRKVELVELPATTISVFLKTFETEVNIYIPGHVSLKDAEEITNAAGEFMEALGFEMKAEEEPISNSLWQRIKFAFKSNVTDEDLYRVFRKGKQALEKKHIDLPIAEETEKLAEATEKILNSLEKYPTAAIRLGSLVVLKQTVNEIPEVFVHQLSSDQVYALDTKPAVIKDFNMLREWISAQNESPPTIFWENGRPPRTGEIIEETGT